MGLRETWPKHRPFTAVERAFAGAMLDRYRKGLSEFEVPHETLGVRETLTKQKARREYTKDKKRLRTLYSHA